MTIAYSTTVATNRLTAVQAAINSLTFNAPSGTAANGSLVIGTSGFTNTAGTTGVTSGSTGVLVVIPLPNAGVTVSGKVLTLVSSTDTAVATASGTAANAAVINSAGVVVAGGLTVGTSAADVILATTAISANQNVNLNSATITHP